MDFPISSLMGGELPRLLKEISDPPTKLYLRGNLPPENHKLLTVVGSRKYSTYGRQAVETLIGGLRGKPITIVSGLALGIDSLAHKAALDANLHTIAIPGSGLEDSVIYPRSHKRLAHDILKAGGALLSEFEPKFEATPWCFTKRNRIVAGISHATLIIEAQKKSGTLITARLATDYNRDVLTVPGSIFSGNSTGPHMLIRLGAVPIRSTEDILEVFDMDHDDTQEKEKMIEGLSPEERSVMELLTEPLHRDELIERLKIDVKEGNILLSMMELNGYVKERGGKISRSI